MQSRNYIIFVVLATGTLIGWYGFVMPRVMPRPHVAANAPGQAPDDANADAKPGNKPRTNPATKHADAVKKEGKTLAEAKLAESRSAADETQAKLAADRKRGGAAEKKTTAPPTFPRKALTIGSDDPQTGYYLQVDLSSQGASVSSIELNDPRYRELKKNVPLKVVGNNLKTQWRTLATDVPDIDALLPDAGSLAERDWSVADVIPDPDIKGINKGVTFRYPSPDGELVIEKHYSLQRVKGSEWDDATARAASQVRDNENAGYLLHLDVTLKNVGPANRSASYVLQGPVGLPLENAENTKKFRDLKMGFLSGPGAVSSKSYTASQIISDEDKNKVEEWKAPLQYIGVDVQYFAALIIPRDDQLDHRTVERSMPMLLDKPAEKPHTDLSVVLESKKVELNPHQEVVQRFELFAGPKRSRLLTPLDAQGILDTAWLTPSWLSHAMLLLLQFFHSVGIPYGLAIICLTIVVRGLMFPVTWRQTMQAQRMKDLQPKMTEIKKKYANDKEKLAMENLRLMKEHKVNPLSGCLPLCLQLPILGGLWTALNSAVDLRRAPVLYIDNLAAPDAFFHLPFKLPVLGWDFNLLPCITVALFVVQQKMFMPPPTDEQQQMQYKMMNIMTIVMGVMFYTVPAGLCVYLISSSVWSMGERKILGWRRDRQPDTPAVPTIAEEDKSAKPSKAIEKSVPIREGVAGTLWKKLLAAADSAGSQTSTGAKPSASRGDRAYPSGKKNGKRPR